jgi:hypothetical protein
VTQASPSAGMTAIPSSLRGLEADSTMPAPPLPQSGRPRSSAKIHVVETLSRRTSRFDSKDVQSLGLSRNWGRPSEDQEDFDRRAPIGGRFNISTNGPTATNFLSNCNAGFRVCLAPRRISHGWSGCHRAAIPAKAASSRPCASWRLQSATPQTGVFFRKVVLLPEWLHGSIRNR